MRQLAFALTMLMIGCSGPVQSQSYSAQDAMRGAEFRSSAAGVVGYVFSPCPIPETSPNWERFAALVSAYEKLKAELQESAPHLDLLIVEADLQYELSLVDITCPDADDPATCLLYTSPSPRDS